MNSSSSSVYHIPSAGNHGNDPLIRVAAVLPAVAHVPTDPPAPPQSQTPDNHTVTPGDDQFGFILYSVVVPIAFGIITVIGVCGNILVIHVIRRRRKLRTVTNMLLLNLAVADLSFVLICPPFTAYQLATSSWPFHGLFGEILCKLMHYLLNVTVYVTIYTLVVISVIRWLTIVHSQATVALRTMQNTAIIIVGIWVVMLAVNVPILLSYEVQPLDGVIVCENLGVDYGQRLYTTFFVFAYLLPLTVIGGFSMSILRHIRGHQPSTLKAAGSSRERKRQAARLIVLVIVVFAIFWLPVHVHLLVSYWSATGAPSSRFYQVIAVLWNCLAYFNSCVNPIIYNVASKEFRDSFSETLLCVGWTPEWDRRAESVVTRLTLGGGRSRGGDKRAAAVVIANGQAATAERGEEQREPEDV